MCKHYLLTDKWTSGDSIDKYYACVSKTSNNYSIKYFKIGCCLDSQISGCRDKEYADCPYCKETLFTSMHDEYYSEEVSLKDIESILGYTEEEVLELEAELMKEYDIGGGEDE